MKEKKKIKHPELLLLLANGTQVIRGKKKGYGMEIIYIQFHRTRISWSRQQLDIS